MLDLLDAPMAEEMPADLPARLAMYPETEVRESYAELYQLYKDGQLFAEDDYEKYSNTMVKSPVKSMCLNVAHDCNLRCEYCFAQQGDNARPWRHGVGRFICSFCQPSAWRR